MRRGDRVGIGEAATRRGGGQRGGVATKRGAGVDAARARPLVD